MQVINPAYTILIKVCYRYEAFLHSFPNFTRNIPHNKIGVTTVGEVRAAGGDVIKTSGRSPNHATLTNLTPETISALLNPPIKNPNKTK